jgi:glycosyltransferase involved in cell wall biosynthesis
MGEQQSCLGAAGVGNALPKVAPLKVLHLCSDYAKQHVYRELVAHLDVRDVEQFVYVPVRSVGEIGVNRDDGLRRTTYRFSHVLRLWHRLLFRTKIDAVARDLVAHTDPSRFDLVHAHFLYSDGAVALKLRERFGVPYVVAVRNTDVNVFMRYRPDLARTCWRIVAGAANVVFITPAYLDVMLSRAPLALRAELKRKARIVPNGVAPFWIENAPPERPAARDGDTLKLLYVGDFSRNKNVLTTIRVAARLCEERPTTLTLVGGGGDGEREVDALLATGRHPFVERQPRVADRVALANIFRSHDIFVMPSFSETFGVVYLEALSQGLPIVYTRRQGVDGYFATGTIGAAVDPHDVDALRGAVLDLAARLPGARRECVAAVQPFAWPKIAARYAELYASAAYCHDSG